MAPPAAADSSAPPQQGRHKRRAKSRPALTPEEAAEVVLSRAKQNGSERINLKGKELDGPESVRAVCEAVMALDAPRTRTLNLAAANVCCRGAVHLASLLADARCALRELNLVDNPGLTQLSGAAASSELGADGGGGGGGAVQARKRLVSTLESKTC